MSHAAVVARGWGLPAVVDASGLDVQVGGVIIGDRWVPEWESIAIDGTTGEVRVDSEVIDGVADLSALTTLLSWADDITGDDASSHSPRERLEAAQSVVRADYAPSTSPS